MTAQITRMRREIDEIPEAVERLLSGGAADMARVAAAARDLEPSVIVSVARGSSDHVCTYLKYASEILLGVPVASVGPSVASIYGAPLRLKGDLRLSVDIDPQSFY